MSYLFNTFLYQPIINVLVFLYNTVAFHDLGVAILMLTVLVRLILAPLYHKMLHQQAMTQKMRPEMMKIQEEYKGDKEKQTQLLMELYKKHKVNPFFSFIVLIIQLPILWALFRAFTNGLNGGISGLLYPFISDPGTFNSVAFGFINLNERNIVLIVLTAIVQFVQSWLSSPTVKKEAVDPKAPKAMPMPSGKVMGVFLALFTAFVLWKLPAAVAIYWFTSTLFAIGQQSFCLRLIKNAESKGNNN
ncbi:MAG: YidC/Oxa1 family membrane protein insertase [Parcubacteria group bacterium]